MSETATVEEQGEYALSPEEEAELDALCGPEPDWHSIRCGCEVVFGEGDEVEYRVARCKIGEALEEQRRRRTKEWFAAVKALPEGGFALEIPEWDAVQAAGRAWEAHFDRGVAAAKRKVRAELLTALEGLMSEDRGVAEAARNTPAGQMWIAAARKRRLN